ncbi:MAG: hypothetical protein J6D21_11485 [Clostridia bacterium]|nr:hypothetical protein [Clostridia bacterium]
MTLARRILALLLFGALLLVFGACDSQPLAAYNDAATKTVMEQSYRQSWSLRAIASSPDLSQMEVRIEETIACTGNTASTYQAVGQGTDSFRANYTAEVIEMPYNIYARDGYTYYEYLNYFEDGSDYRYKVPMSYEEEDEVIRDMLTVYLVDIERASTDQVDGRTVITMHMKDEEIAYYMEWAVETLDWMMFDEEAPELTFRNLVITTTLDAEGRIAQSTATVEASGQYDGFHLSMVYVYDLQYFDYGADLTLIFPSDLHTYEE